MFTYRMTWVQHLLPVFFLLSISDHKPILLDEDTYLKGFAPLKFSDETLTYCHKISDSKNVKNTLRLVKIFQYANSLCDFDNQIIKKILIESDTIAFVGSSLCSAEVSTHGILL